MTKINLTDLTKEEKEFEAFLKAGRVKGGIKVLVYLTLGLGIGIGIFLSLSEAITSTMGG